MFWKMLKNIFRFMEIVLYLKVQPPDFIGKLLHYIVGAFTANRSSCIRKFQPDSGNMPDLDYSVLFLNRNNSALTYQSAQKCADTDSVNSDSKVEVEQFNVTPSEGTSEMPSVSEDPKTVNRCSVETEPQTVSKRGAQETLVSLIPERREPRNLSEGKSKILMKKSTEHKQCKRDNKIGDYLTSLRSSCKQMQVVHADLPPYVSHQCKEMMRPVKKSLILLDFTEKGLIERDQNMLIEWCILRLGRHIEKHVGEMTDRTLIRKWYRYLWMFVAQFTDMDHMTLQYIYEMAVTIRAQDKHNLKVKSESLTEKHVKKRETSTKDHPPFNKLYSDMDCDNNYDKEKKQDQFCKDENFQSDKYRSEHGCHKDTSGHESHKDKNCHVSCRNESQYKSLKDETLHQLENENSHHKTHKSTNDKNCIESHKIVHGDHNGNKNHDESHRDKKRHKSHKHESQYESHKYCKRESGLDQSVVDKAHSHEFHKDKSHSHRSCKEDNHVDKSSDQLSKEKNVYVDNKVDRVSLGDHQHQNQPRPTSNVSIMPAASSNSTTVARDIWSYQIPLREAGKKDASRQAATWTYASPLARVEPFIQSHYVRFKFKRRYTSSSPSRDCQYGSHHRDSNCSDRHNEHGKEKQESHSSDTERGQRTSRKRKIENMTEKERQIKSPRRHPL